MNRHPPQSPNGRLDSEERALAAMLPRLHGRSEPGADLDARILAAAHAAVHASAGGSRPPHRRGWIGPTALAASLLLAVGLAWQLRPLPRLPAPTATGADAATAPAAESTGMATREVAAPATAPEADSAQSRPMAAPQPPAEPTPPPARVAETPITVEQKAIVVEAAPVAPPAPPAPPASVVMDTPRAVDAVPAPAMPEAARAQAPANAKAAQAGAVSRERASTATDAAAQVHDAAAMAAEETTMDTISVDDAGEEVPPATADSPEVRAAWLRRIGELSRQGKTEEAKASLDEFRRRYPDAGIPPELRKLED
jgi:outer membrane biosynthesis protein TonB